MVLLYGRAYRHEQRQGKLAPGIVPTFIFVLGYLLAWGVFSAIATGLQWGLERAGLIHQMLMWSINPLFSAAILIVAGLYQLDSAQDGMSQALPITSAVPFPELPTRCRWRSSPRLETWPLLPGMLLVPYGAPIRRRDHELGLDRRSCGLRSHRKSCAQG